MSGSDIFNQVASTALNVAVNAPAVEAAVANVVTDAKTVAAPGLALGNVGARLVAAEGVIDDITKFLAFLFPGHPGLPASK
jgi:hypothetical protein